MAQAGATLNTLGRNPEEEFTAVSRQAAAERLKPSVCPTCEQASVAQLRPDLLQDPPRGRGSLHRTCRAKVCSDMKPTSWKRSCRTHRRLQRRTAPGRGHAGKNSSPRSHDPGHMKEVPSPPSESVSPSWICLRVFTTSNGSVRTAAICNQIATVTR